MTNATTEPLPALQQLTTLPQRPFFSGKMPLPPSVNAAYKRVTVYNKEHERVGRLGSSDELEQFKHDAALMLTQAYADWSLINAIRDASRKRKTPLAVSIQAYFTTEWKRDLDGVIKYVIDAAFTRMNLKDVQVVRVEADKFVDPIEPRVEIDVRCVVREPRPFLR